MRKDYYLQPLENLLDQLYFHPCVTSGSPPIFSLVACSPLDALAFTIRRALARLFCFCAYCDDITQILLPVSNGHVSKAMWVGE